MVIFKLSKNNALCFVAEVRGRAKQDEIVIITDGDYCEGGRNIEFRTISICICSFFASTCGKTKGPTIFIIGPLITGYLSDRKGESGTERLFNV